MLQKHPGCKLPPYEQQAYTCLGPGTKRTLAEKRRAHCEYQVLSRQSLLQTTIVLVSISICRSDMCAVTRIHDR